MAGALSWGTTHTFRRVGRAVLRPALSRPLPGCAEPPLAARARPLFAHAHGWQWKISKPLRAALAWWEEVLSRRIVETRAWRPDARPPALLLCDARGEPPRLAAVLVSAGHVSFTEVAPPEMWLRRARAPAAPAHSALASAGNRLFRERNDAQIAGLEILAIAVGLSTFADALRGRKVRIFSDNVVAEGALRRGAARAFDHNGLIHAAWTLALAERIHIWVDRVPSKLNISDLPSREEYRLLERLGATRVAPKIAPAFLHHNFA